MNRDARAAARAFSRKLAVNQGRNQGRTSTDALVAGLRAPILAEDVFPKAFEGRPAPAKPAPRCPGLDELIASLPFDSGERYAWEELRRFRERVVAHLDRIDDSLNGKRPAHSIEQESVDLVFWMLHAEREWPKPGGRVAEPGPGGPGRATEAGA